MIMRWFGRKTSEEPKTGTEEPVSAVPELPPEFPDEDFAE